MRKGLNQCPVEFSINNEYSNKDTRFIEVTVDIMHTGDNLNMTNFTREVIDAAIPTLKNIPILGYIVNPYEEDSDFKGHEHEIVVTDDGDIKYIYSGRAYGVIPETCNPRWVTKDDGTGVMREYLRADGVLWTKFDDSAEIFSRDGSKNHSVELTNMSGKVDKRGYYVVNKFDFDGCCILSTSDPKIRPAMTGSNITANFSVSTIAGEIKAMLNEFQVTKDYCLSEEGKQEFVKGESVMDEKLNILNEFGLDATSFEFSLDDISVDELKAKCAEFVAEHESDEPEVAEVVEPAAENEAEPEAEVAEEVEPVTDEAENTVAERVENETESEFALNTIQMLDEVSAELRKEKYVDAWGDEYFRFHLEELADSDAIVYDYCDCRLYGIPYEMNGDNVVLNFEKKRRMKCSYVEWDEGEQPSESPLMMFDIINKHASDYAELKAQYDEILPQFNAFVEAEAAAKAAVIEAKFTALYEQMDERLGDCAEYAALKANKELSYEEAEKECYALVGRKNVEFSYVPSKHADDAKTVRFGVFGSQAGASSRYGDLFEKFSVNK